MAVIERRKDLASTKDRHILESIYDVDIIKSNGRICTLGSTLIPRLNLNQFLRCDFNRLARGCSTAFNTSSPDSDPRRLHNSLQDKGLQPKRREQLHFGQ